MWTYQQLKAADAALSPPVPDPVQAAVILNTQTISIAVDIPTADARAVLLLSGEWFKVKQLSKMSLSGSSPPTHLDQAIAAADICVDTFTLTDILHTSGEAEWAAMQPMIEALQSAGVVSAASVAVWVAKRSINQPRWEPPLTDQDLLHARSL